MIEVVTLTPVARATVLRYGTDVRSVKNKATELTLPAVPLDTGRAALLRARSAAAKIIKIVQHIDYRLAHADVDGLIADTGFARYRQQTEIGKNIRKIDQSVLESAYFGINFLSKNSNNVRLRTTSLGGSVLVSPLPLDTRTLGLSELRIQRDDFKILKVTDDLSVLNSSPRVSSPTTTSSVGILSDTQIRGARETVKTALRIAGQKLSRLDALYSLISDKEGFLTKINPTRLSVDIRSLPRGSFVNVIG